MNTTEVKFEVKNLEISAKTTVPASERNRLVLQPYILKDTCCFGFLSVLGLNGCQIEVNNTTPHDCHVILRPMKGCRVVSDEEKTFQAGLSDSAITGQVQIKRVFRLVGQIAETQCFFIQARSTANCNLSMGLNKEEATLFVSWEGIPPETQEVTNLELASSSHFEVLGGQRVQIRLIQHDHVASG